MYYIYCYGFYLFTYVILFLDVTALNLHWVQNLIDLSILHVTALSLQQAETLLSK